MTATLVDDVSRASGLAAIRTPVVDGWLSTARVQPTPGHDRRERFRSTSLALGRAEQRARQRLRQPGTEASAARLAMCRRSRPPGGRAGTRTRRLLDPSFDPPGGKGSTASGGRPSAHGPPSRRRAAGGGLGDSGPVVVGWVVGDIRGLLGLRIRTGRSSPSERARPTRPGHRPPPDQRRLEPLSRCVSYVDVPSSGWVNVRHPRICLHSRGDHGVGAMDEGGVAVAEGG